MTTFEQSPRRGNLTGGEVPPDRLKQALGWMQSEMPIEMVVGVNGSIWLTWVESFREAEETMPVEEFNEALLSHRPILSRLITEGENIIYHAKLAKLDKLPSGFTVADLEATLETLHIAFKCQHRRENNPKINSMIEGLFNVA